MARAMVKVIAQGLAPARAKVPATVSESVKLERPVPVLARETEDARAKASAREPEFVMDHHCRPVRPALAPLRARELCSVHEALANAMARAFVRKRASRVSAEGKVTAQGLESAQGLAPALERRTAWASPICRATGNMYSEGFYRECRFMAEAV
jgi:hypothetical protein